MELIGVESETCTDGHKPLGNKRRECPWTAKAWEIEPVVSDILNYRYSLSTTLAVPLWSAWARLQSATC